MGRSSVISDVSKQIVNQLENSKSKSLNNKRNHKICEADHKAIDDFIVSKLWGEFEIRTQEAGWVTFCLSETGLSLWLTHLNSQLNYFINHYLEVPTGQSTQLISIDSIQNGVIQDAPLEDERVWQAQYAHGRGCSLLRLWNAQVDERYRVTMNTAIALEDLPSAIAREQNRDRSASAQQQVIHTLITLLDLAESDLFWIPYRYPSKQYFLLLKAVCQLCQSFEQFLAIDLSGFGQVNPQAAASTKSNFQARFALVSIVQKTLKVLLVRCLGISAPTHL